VKAGFRDIIEKGSRFAPEANRYHLYVSYACPWACRCVAVLYLKGLDHIIGLSVVHPTWARTRPDHPTDKHTGWCFKDPKDPPVPNSEGHGRFDCTDCIPDTVNNTKTIRDLYDLSHDTTGKYSVPVLWDKKERTIVCNESEIIMEIFNCQFNDFAKNPTLDLSPAQLKEVIKQTNEWVYPTINDGVYKCGFAKTQEAYEEAFDKLFEALEKMELILAKQRYLCGNRVTSADIRAFVTLVRFDEVYVVYFKCNKKTIKDHYPNIFNYVKDIYQLPGVAKSVNMRHIKTHYYSSHPTLNMYAIIPKGNPVDFNSLHDRNRFSSKL